MSKKFWLSLSFATFVFAQFAAAQNVVLDKSKGHTDFHAVGRPGIIKIHGKGEGPTGTLAVNQAAVTGTLHFNMTTLDTENNMRNEHMKNKYLETPKFPEAILVIKEVSLPSDFFQKKGSSADKAPFKGELTLHGVTKPVSGTVKATNKGETLEGEGHFETKLTDYGIAVPSFAGITVADDVTIDVGFSGVISK